RTVLAPPGKTAAAVLVPLLAVDGAPSLLFTRRSNLLPHHQGQIAFPGGRHHPDADADLAATALREAQEEIGLDPADVRLLGPLAVLVLAALVALFVTRAEPFAPSATLETPVDFVGRATPVRIVAHDRGSGLAHVELRLVPEGGPPVVVASQDYPRRSWLGSG